MEDNVEFQSILYLMAMSNILFFCVSQDPPTPTISKPHTNLIINNNNSNSNSNSSVGVAHVHVSRRSFILLTTNFAVLTISSPQSSIAASSSSSTSNSFLSGIANTKSWFQFYGDGFAIRVPPNFQDIQDPQDDNAGLSLYGDKVKPRTFAARFASTDGSEVLSVVVRPSNQLKITFLEAKDITDLGSLKEAAKIFVPGGATLYSARTFKIKEDESYRNYYFYEFGNDVQRVALVTAVNSGKVVIAGATAPQDKWKGDGVRLRSAAVSLTLV